MERARRFSQLSPARRALVRIMQALNYGELLRIRVTDAEPVFDQASVIIDTKLDKDEVSRPLDFEPRGTPKTGHRWTPEKRPTE